MTNSAKRCWICGARATSREHRTKRSDLRDAFGSPSQRKPLYIHTEEKRNIPVGSLDAKRLKTGLILCDDCNTTVSQPFDRAWETMSAVLRQRVSKGELKDEFRANKIFRNDTKHEMLNVHLFFVKLFGCHIAEQGLPIDIQPFAEAINHRKAYPFVFLKFGRFCPPRTVGMSNIHTASSDPTRACTFAAWLYDLDVFSVEVIYSAESDEPRIGLRDLWHPKYGSKKIKFVNFDDRN